MKPGSCVDPFPVYSPGAHTGLRMDSPLQDEDDGFLWASVYTNSNRETIPAKKTAHPFGCAPQAHSALGRDRDSPITGSRPTPQKSLHGSTTLRTI